MKHVKFKKINLFKRIVGGVCSLVILTSATFINYPITVNAQVNPTSYTVPTNGSSTATFTHKHGNNGSIVTKQIQSNKTVTGATSSGKCYTTANTHTHEGNSTSGGNCYTTTPKYHTHVESCYPHHTHTEDCKNWQQKYQFKPLNERKAYHIWETCNCCCGRQAVDWQSSTDGYMTYMHVQSEPHNGNSRWGGSNATNANDGVQTYLWWDKQANAWGSPKTCGGYWNPCNVKYNGSSGGVTNDNAPWSGTLRRVGDHYEWMYWESSFGYTCGYTAGQRTSNTPICGKTTSTIEGYTHTLNCPYYQNTIYTNSCGITEGSTIAKATVSSDVNQKLTLSVSNLNAKASYSYVWTRPNGTTVNNSTTLQCDEPGNYTCKVTVKTTINGSVVDSDTVTFTYTATSKNTTVNFYDYDGTTKLFTKTMKRGSEDATVNKATRTGYTFTGYYNGNTQYYDQNGSKKVNNFCPLNGGTVNLYAKYTANTYTITYETHNLTVDTTLTKQDTATFDQPITLTNNAKTYEGYTFNGWYNGNNKMFNPNRTSTFGNWTTPNNVTLSAKYTANSYTLNYSLNKEEAVTTHSKTIAYDSAYGLTASEIASRPDYTGYTFNGWFDGSTKIFNVDGSNTDTGVWKFTKDINAKATYTANPYKVYYNTKESDAPSKILNVTYDSNYALPNADVSSVPAKPGYTFDGWFDSTTDTKIFNTDGTPVSNPYKFDHDITVMVKYHKNTYTVHYNNDDTDDNDLNESQTVVFDTAYLPIDQAPYKIGYVFDGHLLEGTVTFIWDGVGNVIDAVWDFVCGVDGTHVNAYKVYSPKVFDIDIGSDFDNDNVIDSIEDTKQATYDSAYFDLDIPAYIDGYTFDGYYIIELDKWIATYDPLTDTLTKTDTTWVYDDNINWVNDPHNNLTLVRKWHQDTYVVKYNNTDITDTNLDKEQTVVFDNPYQDIEVSPYKEGYIFDGTFLDATNDKIWDKYGKVTDTTYKFITGNKDNDVITTHKEYHAKTYTVNVGIDYNEDGITDTTPLIPSGLDYSDTYTIDFDGTIPQNLPNLKEPGLTLDGFYIAGTNKCIAKYDEATDSLVYQSATWIWDDGKDWNKGDYTPVWNVVAKFVHNDITVNIKTETDTKETTGIGNKSNYTFSTKERVEKYDLTYADDTVPVKRGYTFTGYVVNPKADSEPLNIWNNQAKSTEDTFVWLPVSGNSKVEVISTFTANAITGEIPVSKYDPKKDEETPNPIAIDEVYDEPYKPLPFIPEKEGYDFDGITDKDDNPIWDKDGNPTQDVWQYINEDIDEFIPKWKPKTYILTWDNGKEQEITFGKEVPDISTMSKTGYTFSGYSFDYFGKETFIINSSGKFTAEKWTYDVGISGTKIPLKDLYNANTYIVTVKAPDKTYDVEVVYDMAYNNVDIPSKTGYVFNGYATEFNMDYPEELSVDFWDNNGVPLLDTYKYAHNISVLAKWTPKTFYLHCGDEVIAVTYGEHIGRNAPVMTKDSTSDKNYTYDYSFTGWFLNDEEIFNAEGFSIVGTWNKDLGANGTHVYLTDNYDETKTEIPKPEIPTPKEEEPEPEPEVVVVPEPTYSPKPIDWNYVVGTVVKTTAITISILTIIAFICFIILFILFILGEISLLYVYNPDKEKKVLKGIVLVRKVKKKDREANNDDIRYRLYLHEKYYNKILDVDSKLLSIKFAPHWVDRRNAERVILKNEKDIRISCKNKYGEFSMASIKTKKGDVDRGFVELRLDKEFN